MYANMCFVDLMQTVMEASSFTPSVYSVHALTLLAEVNQFTHLLSGHQSVVVPVISILHLDYVSSCSHLHLPPAFRPVALRHSPTVHYCTPPELLRADLQPFLSSPSVFISEPTNPSVGQL